MAISKVILDGSTLLDVTNSTVNAQRILSGYVAKGADGVDVTGAYVPQTPTDYVVTVTYNAQTEMWEPDCTYAEVSAAYTAGKTIVVDAAGPSVDATADGEWDDYQHHLEYWVHQYYEGAASSIIETQYRLTSNGLIVQGTTQYVVPSGSTSITANGTYDVTDYAQAVVSVSGGGGGSVKLGALRPDTELVQSWTVDRLFVDDDGGTLPTYSTSATALVAQADLSPAVAVDMTQYDYMVVQRGLVTPVYSNSAASAGRMVAFMMSYVAEYSHIPSGSVSADGAAQAAAQDTIKTQDSEYWFYCTGASSISAVSLATKQGLYMNPASNSVATSLTAKSPSVYIRGHTTYMNSANWGYLTDVRYQYVVEVYRVAKTQAGPNGFMAKTQVDRIIDCFNSASGTLS